MEKMVKDGWYKVQDCNLRFYEVYVEDGEVKRGISDGCTAYPYRVYRNAGWDKDLTMTLDELRAGLLCGNVVIA